MIKKWRLTGWVKLNDIEEVVLLYITIWQAKHYVVLIVSLFEVVAEESGTVD